MTTENLLASRLIANHGSRRVFIADLNSYEQELFDRVIEQAPSDVAGDWVCEGAINLHCSQGSVQIYGSAVCP